MPGVGVDTNDASDLTVDPGLLARLPDGRLGNGLAEINRAPGSAQLPLSVRRIIRMSPASLTTATLTEGAMLFTRGAAGSL